MNDTTLAAAVAEIRRAGVDLGLDVVVVGELVERVAGVRAGSGDAVRRRNRALQEAADILRAGNTTMSLWKLAGRMEGSIRWFESAVWPRVRNQAAPDLTPLEGALFAAFTSGARMVRTQRRLFELLD